MKLLQKKKIYSLLFSKPLFDYAIEKEGKRKLNIMILGNNEEAIEAFKAVYWCGQMSSEYETSITICSSCPNQTAEKYEELMPAINNNGVISTKIHFSSTDDINNQFYGYIFVCENSDAIIETIPLIIKDGKQLICALNENIAVEQYQNENLDVFNLCDTSLFVEQCRTLDRYAYNCDYAYSMGENERCAKKSYENFVCSDEESENDRLRVKYYNYLSSLTFPVHIPYKLQICGDTAKYTQKQQKQILLKSIQNRDKLYNTLLDVEHRRWTAYMISEGWRMPNEEELMAYAYQNFGYPKGNDQRNKMMKLHPCICNGSENGCSLDVHPELWKEFYYNPKYTLAEAKEYLKANYKCDFSDLEAISLVLYSLVCLRCKDVNANLDSYFKFIEQLPYSSDERKIYEHLYESAKKLRNNEPNSSKLFLNSLNEAVACAKDTERIKQINDIDCAFHVVVERNKQKNYFTIDSTMIDMIPFSIWYGVENKTVVVFSTGLASDDVIIPTLLCADKAIFVGSDMTQKYKESIRSYFKGRHIVAGEYEPQNLMFDTEVEFIPLKKMVQDDVSSILEKIIADNQGVAIGCLSNNEIPVTMAIGTAADKYEIPVYHYSREKSLNNIKNGSLITPGLSRKSFSLDEYINLLGGEYSNIFSISPHIHEMTLMENIFKQYAPFEYSKQGKNRLYSAWSALYDISGALGRKGLLVEGKTGKQYFKGGFESDIFHVCGIAYLLKQLDKFKIISDLYISNIDDGDLVYVEFTYYDSGIKDIIDPYIYDNTKIQSNKKECLDTMICFSLSDPKQILSKVNLNAVDAQVCNKDEAPDIKRRKQELVKAFNKANLIQSLNFTSDGCKASFKVSNFTMFRNIKNQGNTLEILLYNKFRYSGMFDDVQTGVRFSWNNSGKTLEDYVLENHFPGSYGWEQFTDSLNSARRDYLRESIAFDTNNEIDVMLMKNMVPTFISCKIRKPENESIKNWLYEVSSLANQFHANAVLALTVDLDKNPATVSLNRAKNMGVSLIGTETILDETRMSRAIRALAEGKTVYGNETK